MATRIARRLAMSLAGIALAFLSSGDEAWAAESIESVDTATERLLQLLALDGLTSAEAVAQTAAELGPDPSFEAELRVLTSGG